MVKVSTTDFTPSTWPANHPYGAQDLSWRQGRRGAREVRRRGGQGGGKAGLGVRGARRGKARPVAARMPCHTGIELESQLVDDVEERIEDTHQKLEPVYGLRHPPGVRLVDP